MGRMMVIPMCDARETAPRSARGWRRAAAVGALAVSAGIACAPKSELPEADRLSVEQEREAQREVAIRTSFRRQQRLADLAWPIQRDGAELCEDRVAPSFGMQLTVLGAFDVKERDAARRALGVTANPTVTLVVRDSPAWHADIRPGDVLTHVGPTRIRSGSGGLQTAVERLAEYAETREAYQAVPVRLTRDREPYVQELLPEPGCDYPVLLHEDASINAFADGDAAYITTGMMRFTESDQELQFVIAHELSHNLAGHIRARQGNMILGAILGAALDQIIGRTTGVYVGATAIAVGAGVAGRVHSQDFEREADYIGAYLLARAGADPTDLPLFWRRMAIENTGSIENHHASSHPSSPERFVALEAALEEIAEKEAAGEPLVPNRKE